MLIKFLEGIAYIFARRFAVIKLRLLLTYSRSKANGYRRRIVHKKGTAVVNRQIKKKIKNHACQRFGNRAYWPYLALYTEVRGRFIEGWIPYDYYRYIMLPKINPEAYRNLSNFKTLDYKLFGEYVIKPLLLYISGIFFNANMETIGIATARNILNDFNNQLVIKEEFGMGGKQVKFYHSSELSLQDLNSDINYLIQPFINQYSLLNDLYPDSVNTFRVTTLLPKAGNVQVRYIILRFGVDGLKVDNLSSGGNYINFDSSGNPSAMAYDSDGLEVGLTHKNTGFLFSELMIPMFSDILTLCCRAHMKYPYVGIIGWDVCVDKYGKPLIIEWNAFSPGIWPEETTFGPFFSDITFPIE